MLVREEFGHFEGDSILSVRPTLSALRTEVERVSRFILVKKIARKTARLTRDATLTLYQSIPKAAIKSITYDNGVEHAEHEAIAEALLTTIYFARPYHSWER